MFHQPRTKKGGRPWDWPDRDDFHDFHLDEGKPSPSRSSSQPPFYSSCELKSTGGNNLAQSARLEHKGGNDYSKRGPSFIETRFPTRQQRRANSPPPNHLKLPFPPNHRKLPFTPPPPGLTLPLLPFPSTTEFRPNPTKRYVSVPFRIERSPQTKPHHPSSPVCLPSCLPACPTFFLTPPLPSLLTFPRHSSRSTYPNPTLFPASRTITKPPTICFGPVSAAQHQASWMPQPPPPCRQSPPVVSPRPSHVLLLLLTQSSSPRQPSFRRLQPGSPQ